MRKTILPSRGYSLSELLIVVAMIGVVTLVTVPALVQLMPQYRIRSAASEAAGNLRMIRQHAITTRSAWRVTIDPVNNRYRYYMLNPPNANLSVAANWDSVGRDGRGRDPSDGAWITTSVVDLNAAPTSFNDVTCPSDSQLDIIFLRDGTLSDKEPCGGTSSDTLDFPPDSPDPSIVFAVDNNSVSFNRYYITVAKNGRVSVNARKE